MKVIAPAFYAIRQAHVAVMASVAAVAGNVACNLLLHRYYGYRVLAAGTALSALINAGVLYAMFQRRVARVAHHDLLLHLARVLAAAAIMGAVVWGCHKGLDRSLGHDTTRARLIVVGVPVLIGGAVYAAACALLRVEELERMAAKVWRKLRG